MKKFSGANIDFNCTTSDMYQHSCLERFGDYVKAHAVSLGAGGLVLALFQVKKNTLVIQIIYGYKLILTIVSYFQLIGVFITYYIARKLKLTSSHSNF